MLPPTLSTRKKKSPPRTPTQKLSYSVVPTQHEHYLVPSCTLACERVFEERSVMGDLEVEGLVVFVLVCDVEWRWKKTGRTERKKKKKNKAVS